MNLQSIIIDPENKYLYSGNKSICNSDNTLFAVFADGTIPETTVSISADAFLSYRGKELFVPKNVVEIKLKGEHISFADIETLTAVEVDPDNPTYYSENGKIYLKQSGELYFDPSENKNNE